MRKDIVIQDAVQPYRYLRIGACRNLNSANGALVGVLEVEDPVDDYGGRCYSSSQLSYAQKLNVIAPFLFGSDRQLEGRQLRNT